MKKYAVIAFVSIAAMALVNRIAPLKNLVG